jgi:hypothetical protein
MKNVQILLIIGAALTLAACGVALRPPEGQTARSGAAVSTLGLNAATTPPHAVTPAGWNPSLAGFTPTFSDAPAGGLGLPSNVAEIRAARVDVVRLGGELESAKNHRVMGLESFNGEPTAAAIARLSAALDVAQSLYSRLFKAAWDAGYRGDF